MKKYNLLIITICFITINLNSQDNATPKVLMRCTYEDSTKQNIYKNDIAILNFDPKSKSKNKYINQSKGLKILHISNDSILVFNSKKTYQISKSEITGIQILNNKFRGIKSKLPINGLTISGLILGLIGLAGYSTVVSSFGAFLTVILSIPMMIIGFILLLVGLFTSISNDKSNDKLKEFHEGNEIRFNDVRCNCKTILYP
ncbi:MAG: hypothetical protein IPJ43_06050 [Saprospiraceae bacterium]|nr:hypothetical protein [Saprospiraceae bacterium]